MVRQGVPAHKITVIHNGIDLAPYQLNSRLDGLVARREWDLSPDQKVVGTVGRLVPIKGYDIFLQAAAKIAAYAADTMFLMIGEGPCEEELKEQARELGLQDRVIFAGHRKDIPRLFRAMDLFVISSFSEGGPIVLLEAMASEVPVVATRVGGVPEVLVDKVNGLMVEPHNSLDLADKVIHLLKAPELGDQFRQAGLATVHSEFTQERVTEKTEQLYEQIISNGR
jgi:glycosyltransferase involved in cell wall biosynthesis